MKKIINYNYEALQSVIKPAKLWLFALGSLNISRAIYTILWNVRSIYVPLILVINLPILVFLREIKEVSPGWIIVYLVANFLWACPVGFIVAAGRASIKRKDYTYFWRFSAHIIIFILLYLGIYLISQLAILVTYHKAIIRNLPYSFIIILPLLFWLEVPLSLKNIFKSVGRGLTMAVYNIPLIFLIILYQLPFIFIINSSPKLLLYFNLCSTNYDLLRASNLLIRQVINIILLPLLISPLIFLYTKLINEQRNLYFEKI